MCGAALCLVQSILQAIAVWGLQLRSAEAVAERSYMRSKTKCSCCVYLPNANPVSDTVGLSKIVDKICHMFSVIWGCFKWGVQAATVVICDLKGRIGKSRFWT